MNIRFIQNRNKFFAFSIVLVLITIIATFINGVKMDIQFSGGYIVTYSYDGMVDKDKLEKLIEETINEKVNIQETKDIGTNINKIVVSLSADKSLNVDIQNKLEKMLNKQFSDNHFKEIQVSNVDPVIGKEFLSKCMVAVVTAVFLMIIYIGLRFKKIGGWSAAVMAVIALIHDMIMIYGTVIICKVPLGESFIAGCLTILGYSINDTIIIYDRIRENKKIYGSKLPIGELVNKSINQSFTRTINTTLTTVMSLTVVLIVTLIYGLNSIVSFILPLIVGMISGAYSTIFIAGPLWVVWQERQKKKRIEKIRETND